MQTLKSNNAKLTAALKESNHHVAEWKEKLQQYKEENTQLKKKVLVLQVCSIELSVNMLGLTTGGRAKWRHDSGGG